MKIENYLALQALFEGKKDKPEKAEKKAPPTTNDLAAYIRVSKFLEKQAELKKKEEDEKKKEKEKNAPKPVDAFRVTLYFIASFPVIAPIYLYFIAQLLNSLPK